MRPQQGEIYWVNLNPTKGSEQAGKRPVLVISGNTMNSHFPVSIICPLTTNVKNYAGCTVIKKNAVNKLPQDSEVITFQVRTCSHQRFKQKVGSINSDELESVLSGLNDILKF